MKFYKILHQLLIGCSVLIYLSGIWVFWTGGNFLLGGILFYGLLSGLYFSLAVLLSEEDLSRIRCFFNMPSRAESGTFISYEQLLRDNTALVEELTQTRESSQRINDYALSMITDWDNYQQAYLILEKIKLPADCKISNN